MNKIKAVIFDLDGTIANTVPLCIEAFRRSVEPLVNRSVSDKEIMATFGPSEEGTIWKLVPEFYEKGISDYLHHYKALHDMCPAPFEGIEDLLISLKRNGVRIAMVTGKGKCSTKISLERFKISHFFEMIETGHPSGPRKADGIQSVLTYFKELDKKEIIYVGDAPNDIIASRKAGISVVSAAWTKDAETEKLKELGPDQLFYHISDFKSWLFSNI